jgi:hypothetical protein
MNAVLAACALSEAAVRARLTREAQLLRNLLTQYVDRDAIAGFGVVSWGSVARFAGRLESLLGRWADAESNLRKAVERDAASGCEGLLARSELALAEMLAARHALSDESESNELVGRALRRIHGKGLTQLEHDAATVSQAWAEAAVPLHAGRSGG